MTTSETWIHWDTIDKATFQEFCLAKADELAQAFVAETFSSEPDNTRLNSLYEIGQSRFSPSLNNREAREKLFMQIVTKLSKEMEA